MSRVVRTIAGDLPAELLGPTYAHEHLIIDTPLVARSMPQIHLHSVEEARNEVQTCIEVGVRAMVDAMPAASGRDPQRLTRISMLTGMRIVAATGLHTAKYYEGVPWTSAETAEELAERFIADIEVGIDTNDYLGEEIVRSTARAGIVKVAALSEELSPRDRRLFQAGAITNEATGAAVLTHAEAGLGGLTQIDTLLSYGVAPDRIALSHTDRIIDPAYHRSMLETGVFLCYDQGLRDGESTFALVDRMADEGFAGQIVLGTDGARRSLWSTLGGSPGLAALYQMAERRLEPLLVEKLFVENPARYLSLAA